MNNEHLAQAAKFWLAGLPDKAFVEILYEVIRDRKPNRDTGGYFVIADAEPNHGMGVDVSYIAEPDPKQASGIWADDVPICQSGRCAACGAAVRSWAKQAICPLCTCVVGCT